MKLEFAQHSIHESLHAELDLDAFLAGFDLDLPLWPRRVLRPMGEEAGKAHFKNLEILDRLVQNRTLDLENALASSRRLPSLEGLIPLWHQGALDHYHLFTLGTFAAADHDLRALEAACRLEDGAICDQVLDILRCRMSADFSGLVRSEKDDELLKALHAIEERLKDALRQYELAVQQATGLKLIYPYPRDLPPDAPEMDRIRACDLVTIEPKGDFVRVTCRLPQSIQDRVAEKKRLREAYDRQMDAGIKAVNQELSPLFERFAAYYGRRRERVYALALLNAKQTLGLCLPEFRDGPGCRFVQARLPGLEHQAGTYVPLDLDFPGGAHLLFGANLTGKTTVLKTVYFQIQTIRMGLPVPARAVELAYPGETTILLKSSGDLRRQVSGFGAEIAFFARTFQDHAVVLADELFQSTDPVNGADLARIMLQEFQGRNLIFLCTSHYPELLALPGISRYKMKDPIIDSRKTAQEVREDLLNRMPYCIEPVNTSQVERIRAQNTMPLKIALVFDLPESVKFKIRAVLDDRKCQNTDKEKTR